YYADSSAIDMFDLTTISGNPVKALGEPNAIVITESMAKKVFGSKDPIGQKLTLGDEEEMWVRAVIGDLPSNSHLKFDCLASMPTFYKTIGNGANSRGWMFGWTYVLFKNGKDVSNAKNKLKNFYLEYYNPFENPKDASDEAEKGRFQPITSIHLQSDLIQEMGQNSNILYIYIFIAVEILILLIACVNFINLFTTQALKRMKEVGMRKLLGATRQQLVLQFIGEGFILTSVSALLALLFYQLSLPFYNHLTGRQVRLTEILSSGNLGIFIAIILSVGFISGLFPALYISNFKPVQSLKATKMPGSSAAYLRKGLVVFQFVVSGLLIISTVLIYQQMSLFRNKKMGFDKDQVLAVKLYGKLKEKLITNPDIVKNEILRNPDILVVGMASNLIGEDLSVEQVLPKDAPADKNYPTVRVMGVDENYLDALHIELKEGRNFSKSFNDSASFIINDEAAKVLELKTPLNSIITNTTSGNITGKVVGIIKDFHFASLHHQVEPLVLEFRPWWTRTLLIKIRAGKDAEAIEFLKSKFAEISPNTLFSYGFLDEKVAGLYSKEDNLSNVLKVFAVLAIVISCLGLFGLTAHAAETRTKEIGIRKVIGAGIFQLISLFSKDLFILVLAGNLLAWPIAWYGVHKWLDQFTDKINISWMVFVMSTLVTVLIAICTIAYHCLKTANANPVKSLRTE
ncbi:MAG TPA: FtsX-like permease family protein, partial [Puia sp.]|nr:FtsX-like permease family protein [Puia sp.]